MTLPAQFGARILGGVHHSMFCRLKGKSGGRRVRRPLLPNKTEYLGLSVAMK